VQIELAKRLGFCAAQDHQRLQDLEIPIAHHPSDTLLSALSFYSRALRPVLFALDAEVAHDITMRLIASPFGRVALPLMPVVRPLDALRQQVFGLDFANPLGLAAGLDKQGTAVPAWGALGFGFAEIGTVTPRPQPGNPKPRLFRLPEDHAVINRFGFNSEGADAVARNLPPRGPTDLRVGINIGKNKEPPNDRAVEDYLAAIDALHSRAEYFVVNVSSPNTPGLRDLQEARALRSLLAQVVNRVHVVSAARAIPVLVKVSPDMADADLLAAVDAAIEGGAAGIVATNTSIGRTGLRSAGSLAREAGGLSGGPLREAATRTCQLLFKHLGGRVPIVGVGGIFTAADAYERIRSGATLVQVYTALIYEGPVVVSRILHGVAERLARDGFAQVHEAIGADVD
jgi:dihydroorotate dehydrogenase